MKYTKFFNSNPSVSGNNAMSNIEALAKFDTWLAGQAIVNISVGESKDTYTPITFTKENGETYTVNIPTVKGDTGAQGPKGDTGAQGPKGDTGAQGPQGTQGPKGDTGKEALSIISVYESATIPIVNGSATLNIDDFNRTPNSGERAIMFVITNDSTGVAKAYITEVSINYKSDTTVSCIYESVNEISAKPTINEFNYIGEWVSGNEYHKNDCVYCYKSSSTRLATYYICLKDISNSTTTPNNDITHWAVISTNASNYNILYTSARKSNVTIKSSTSFPIGSNKYIHFVTLTHNIDGSIPDTYGIIANTLCITNSSSSPSIDDFISFLGEVSQGLMSCIIGNGWIISNREVPSLISGIYYESSNEIGFRFSILNE